MARPPVPKAKVAISDQELDKLLTEAERLEIEEEIKLEVAAVLKAQAKDQYRLKLREEEQRAKGLMEAQIDVTIDLAPYADRKSVV